MSPRVAKSRGRRGLLTTLAVLVAVGIGGPTVLRQDGPSDPPSAETANLWIDTDGGTCTDGAAREYVDAEACSTFDAANDTCDNGDLVLVKAGTYSDQTLTGKNSRTSGCTIREATGEAAVIDGRIQLGSPEASAQQADWLVIDGFKTNGIETYEGSSDWTFRNIDGGDFYIRNSDNGLIEFSDFGPCQSPAGGGGLGCTGNLKIEDHISGLIGSGPNTNFTFRDNTVHDFDLVAPDHYECMFLRGGQNITIERNKFWNCELYDIFMQPAPDAQSGPTSGIVVQNNWFGDATNAAIVLGANSGNLDDVLIRFNSFTTGEGVIYESGTQSNVRVVGNIMGHAASLTGGCGASGVTYLYNMYTSGSCGTGSAAGSLYYVNGTSGASMDLHLTGAAGAADNLVTPTTSDYGLTDDYDGDARTAGSRDAGMDER